MIKENFKFQYKEKTYSFDKCLSLMNETGFNNNPKYENFYFAEEYFLDYLEFINFEYNKDYTLEEFLNIIGEENE